jgi:hypothetical protein
MEEQDIQLIIKMLVKAEADRKADREDFLASWEPIEKPGEKRWPP